jgi:hypothetical protein
MMEVARLRNRDKKGEREMDTCTVTAKCTLFTKRILLFRRRRLSAEG